MKQSIFKFIIILFLSTYGVSAMAELQLVASSFNAPTGITFNQSGDMYVTNWSGNTVTKITAEGNTETIVSNISSPAGIVIDKDNNLYVASYSDNYILKVDAKGVATKISEGYRTPTGIAFANSGELLVTNRSTGEIIALDLISTTKRTLVTGLNTPVGVTQLQDGSLVVSQYSGRLTLINSEGKKTELGSGFVRPGVGIITESENSVVVIDNGGNALRRVNTLTGQTETLVDKLSGAVALAGRGDSFYIGTWNDGSVYLLKK